MDSKDGILVSPSCERGLDLYGDLARFNIWPKMPFPSLDDKVVSKRLYTKPFGDRWYSAITGQSVVQGVGRTTRRIEDFSTARIYDAAFDFVVDYTHGLNVDSVKTRIEATPCLYKTWYFNSL